MTKGTLLFFAVIGLLACGRADSLKEAFARVRSVQDDVCAITNIRFSTSYSTKAAYVTGFETEIESADGAIKSGHVIVDFVLRPEPGSDIRCLIDLPTAATWNGRLWGLGNSGYAGKLPSDTASFAAQGHAVMTTELGTWSVTANGTRNTEFWPDCVWRDFTGRATHLMTVYGRRIATCFYGRQPDYVYFYGGSCGGRQAMGEVTCYPEDYDGVIANLPHAMGVVSDAASFQLYLATHDAAGTRVISTNDLRRVSDLAVKFFAPRDRGLWPYEGRFLSDGRVTPTEVTNFVAFVGREEPTLAAPDLQERLRSIFLPVVHEGRVVFTGVNPGAYPFNIVDSLSIYGFKNALINKGKYVKGRFVNPTWADFEEYAADWGRQMNTSGSEIAPFLKGGRKLIMITGWEDQTVPAGPIVEHFERICRDNGGYDAVTNAVRLFCVPGCGHGGGMGHLSNGSSSRAAVCQQLADWFEKGLAPESIRASKAKGGRCDLPDGTPLPVAVYPGLFYKTSPSQTNWSWRLTPRSPITINPRYTRATP